MATYINPGLDASGNNNTWTTNNINWTSSGVTFDTMTDVPTNTNATTANFCVLNPLFISKQSSWTLANGNLQATPNVSGAGYTVTFATIAVSSGKIYAEFIVSAVGAAGIHSALGMGVNNSPEVFEGTGDIALNQTGTGGYYLQLNNGNKNENGGTASYGSAIAVNDVINFAFDLDNGKIYWGKNGTWFASGDPAAGTNPAFSSIPSGTYSIGLQDYSATGYPCTWQANFGQRGFLYTPPSGFVALNTFNLPTPTIGATASTQANKYFDAALYTGTNSTLTITNSGGLKPDFIWIKSRSNATTHNLADTNRGISKFLFSNGTGAEQTATAGTGITSVNSNGFTLGTDTSTSGNTNTSGYTFVGWQWAANGGTNITNTNGSVTSSVSANTSAGFSVVTYTAQSSGTATMGHGLGVAPAMIIVKSRTVSPSGWNVYHRSLGATKVIYLNSTDAESTSSGNWNNTAPTSTVFTGGTGFANGGNMVAYCFSAVQGYSAMGSYTGNGSTDGVFVYTGFRPKYVLIKNASASGNDWKVFDTARNTANPETLVLYPNLSNAEDTNTGIDFTANGFKLRDNGSSLNGSGNTMIYYAVAENPFKYSLGR